MYSRETINHLDMFRRIILFLTVVISLIGFLSCTQKKETHHEHKEDANEWAEMDEFHMMMAESFHPFMDSGNVEPAKQNAAAMEELATKWAQSSLPEKVDHDEMKRKLNALKVSTANFKTLAEQNDNSVLGDSLTRLHDLYHSIQEAWYGSGEHHAH